MIKQVCPNTSDGRHSFITFEGKLLCRECREVADLKPIRKELKDRGLDQDRIDQYTRFNES